MVGGSMGEGMETSLRYSAHSKTLRIHAKEKFPLDSRTLIQKHWRRCARKLASLRQRLGICAKRQRRRRRSAVRKRRCATGAGVTVQKRLSPFFGGLWSF